MFSCSAVSPNAPYRHFSRLLFLSLIHIFHPVRIGLAVENNVKGKILHMVSFAQLVPQVARAVCAQDLSLIHISMIVGRTIGVEALAAVGATGSISFLIIGFSQGLTSGFAVITAQRFGAGDMDGVRKSVTSGILLGAGITVILTAVSVPLARPVLEQMCIRDTRKSHISSIKGALRCPFAFLSVQIRLSSNSH